MEDDPYYQQSYAPVREQTKATGHSVRAVYLYTAMADLASEINDPSLFHACQRLWDSIARQMYVTGGIGSTGIGEAFTTDYHLPNDTAYAETCASIGLIFFASRMLELDMDGRYGDVMEQAFYNTVLAGMQLDGKRFFYVNPLEVLPGISGVVATHLHDKPLRPSWYACACCPPNIARLITSIGKYAYSSNQTTNYCHLYADGDIQFDNQNLIRCQTGYPYDFTVRYQIISTNRTLAIRIPSWSLNYEILVNDQRITPDLQKGYAYIHDLKAGDQVTLRLDENPHFLYASPKIANDTGCVALQHGPLIYCFEGVDNQGDVLSLRIDDSAPILSCGYDPALLGGTEMLKVSAHRVSDCNSLYTLQKPEETACSAFPGLAEQIRPYHSIPIFSPNASTAFLTHSGHGHNGTPVSIPFRSLQIVPPHLCWKSARISLEYRGVPLPAVRSPATTMAPINAPQVLSMQTIPAANQAVSFISSS